MIPKHHTRGHIPPQIRLDRGVMDMWVVERMNLRVKRIGEPVQNTRNYEHSVLAALITIGRFAYQCIVNAIVGILDPWGITRSVPFSPPPPPNTHTPPHHVRVCVCVCVCECVCVCVWRDGGMEGWTEGGGREERGKEQRGKEEGGSASNPFKASHRLRTSHGLVGWCLPQETPRGT